ncbi:MAG: hypothetical protein Q4A90_01660 [Streptococcus sp.]|nr:hypothetical protein [Streptococcus sp.]
MTEHYLPVRESLGYKNVRKALKTVFSIDLDDFPIGEGGYENFRFDLTYNKIPVMIIVAATGKHQQFEIGEGGTVTISLPDPDYPTSSFLETQFLDCVIKDPTIEERVRHISGRKEEEIEFAFKVLKDYLDSDEAKLLLKNVDVILDTASIDAIGVVEDRLELLLVDPNLWVTYTENNHLLKLQEKINHYIHYLETKQYVERYGDQFKKKVIRITFQYSPSNEGLAFLAQVQKVLEPTDMSLTVVLPD